MKPEGSLPCSQGTATYSDSEPRQSSPYRPILFFWDRLNIILPSTSGLLSILFPSGYPT
jgi:hypothetical protein